MRRRQQTAVAAAFVLPEEVRCLPRRVCLMPESRSAPAARVRVIPGVAAGDVAAERCLMRRAFVRSFIPDGVASILQHVQTFYARRLPPRRFDPGVPFIVQIAENVCLRLNLSDPDLSIAA